MLAYAMTQEASMNEDIKENPKDIFLHIADEDIEAVEAALDRWGTAILTVSSDDYDSPLHAAAVRYAKMHWNSTRKEIFQKVAAFYIKHDVWNFEIDMCVYEDYTYLHCAVMCKDTQIAKAFLDHAKTITFGSTADETPFYCAIQYSNSKIVRLFFERKIFDLVPPKEWKIYLDRAKYGKSYIYFVLVRAGVLDWSIAENLLSYDRKKIKNSLLTIQGKVSPEELENLCDLAWRIRNYCLFVELYALLDDSCQAKSRYADKYNRYRMCAAAQCGDIQEIEALIKEGIPMSLPKDNGDDREGYLGEAITEIGEAPIVQAIKAGHEDVVIYMLKSGAAFKYWVEYEYGDCTRRDIVPNLLAYGMCSAAAWVMEVYPINWEEITYFPMNVEESICFENMKKTFSLLVKKEARQKYERIIARYVFDHPKPERVSWLLDKSGINKELLLQCAQEHKIQIYYYCKSNSDSSLKPMRVLKFFRTQIKLVSVAAKKLGVTFLEPYLHPVVDTKYCNKLLFVYALGLDPTTFLREVVKAVEEDPSRISEMKKVVQAVLAGYNFYLSIVTGASYRPIIKLAYGCITSPGELVEVLEAIANLQGYGAETCKMAKEILGDIRKLKERSENNDLDKPYSLLDISSDQVASMVDANWPVDPDANLNRIEDTLCRVHGRLNAWLIVNFCHIGPLHIAEIMARFYLRFFEDEKFRDFLYK